MVDGRGVKSGIDGSRERQSGAADKDPQGREQRPEEPLPSVAQWMAVVGRASTTEDADEEEDHDGEVGGIGRGLSPQSDGPGHQCRRPQGECLNAVHAKGEEYVSTRGPVVWDLRRVHVPRSLKARELLRRRTCRLGDRRALR